MSSRGFFKALMPACLILRLDVSVHFIQGQAKPQAARPSLALAPWSFCWSACRVDTETCFDFDYWLARLLDWILRLRLLSGWHRRLAATARALLAGRSKE